MPKEAIQQSGQGAVAACEALALPSALLRPLMFLDAESVWEARDVINLPDPSFHILTDIMASNAIPLYLSLN